MVGECGHWHVDANDKLEETSFGGHADTLVTTPQHIAKLDPFSQNWAAEVSQRLEELQVPLPGAQEAQEHTRLSSASSHTAVDFGGASSSEFVVVPGGFSAGPVLHPRADEVPVAPVE